MKNKTLLIVTIIISLLVVGTVAFAANENPDTAPAVKSEVAREGGNGYKGAKGDNVPKEDMVLFSDTLKVEVNSILNKLVTDGVLTADQLEVIGSFEKGKGLHIGDVLGDTLSEEQEIIVKAAMDEFKVLRDEMQATRTTGKGGSRNRLELKDCEITPES
ncbi:MAG: hypothetical protein KAG94_05190 [Clostridiales bacterium]|nr:hypothetical protein [Clostridiales bacterium]